MTMPGDIETRHHRSYREADNNLTKQAVVLEDSGNPVNIFDENTTIPNQGIAVIIYTATESLKVIKASISCFIEGKMTVFVNGAKIATARTSPGRPNAELRFEPYYPIATGDLVEVEFKARPDSPVSEVEALINAFTIN